MLFVNLKAFNRKELVETLKSKENIKAYLLGGILISASWAINIWGVKTNCPPDPSDPDSACVNAKYQTMLRKRNSNLL